MNDLNDMYPICHDCPYWEVCEPPYVCATTEAKYRKKDDENVTQGKQCFDSVSNEDKED